MINLVARLSEGHFLTADVNLKGWQNVRALINNPDAFLIFLTGPDERFKDLISVLKD